MANKKRKKTTKKNIKTPEKQKIQLPSEFFGVVLILLGILGLGRFGVIGKLISLSYIFISGAWHLALLVLTLILGVLLLIKKAPQSKTKIFGILIFIICILGFTHLLYTKSNNLEGFNIVKENIDYFISITKEYSIPTKSGGIIGASLASASLYLFDYNGTKIVLITLAASGVLMFTSMSIYELIKKAKDKIKIPSLTDEQVKEIDDTYEEETKTIISSIDEIINIPKTLEKPVEEIKEEKEEVENITEEVAGEYRLPPMSLLNKPKAVNLKENEKSIKENVKILEQVFEDFGIEGKVVAVNVGPTVTQYEMNISAGTKVNKVLSIHKELALALAAKDIRIEAPIPGKSTVGVEIPNKKTSMVSFKEVLETIPEELSDRHLLVTLGKDIMGNSQWMEINKTPHLLVAGSTGSGKSVCINSMIVSILMRSKPDEVRLVLIDPKKVELSGYNGIPHLLTPVVTDPKKANFVLQNIVEEMEDRYDLFSETGCKNIAGYNAYVKQKNEKENTNIKPLPFIVVIIDELADLMLVAAKEVEESIMRITQMARAAGIHLIVATQRPSTDVITGTIKSNIPSRISFAVSSGIDSRTILDMSGAEKLLGKGDMLFKPQEVNTPMRIQGTFIDENEIDRVVNYVVKEQIVKYNESIGKTLEERNAITGLEGMDAKEEPLYNDMVEFVVLQQKASISALQRRFKIGYNRAASAVDLLEERGIVGPAIGNQAREVLVQMEIEN